MKKVLFFTLCGVMLYACEAPPIEERVEETFANGQPKTIHYVQQIDGKEEVVEQKAFFENGQFKMGGKLLKGKREGMWKAYFEDGKLQSEGEFEGGVRMGIGKVYYPNGQLMYEGQYENDKAIGHWKFYNEEGKLTKEKDF
ncbi:MAG: hypothetical protein J5I47_12485 [Vicingus serpentipes]|nr:hypothetical protein [Vicingus serpentipes]